MILNCKFQFNICFPVKKNHSYDSMKPLIIFFAQHHLFIIDSFSHKFWFFFSSFFIFIFALSWHVWLLTWSFIDFILLIYFLFLLTCMVLFGFPFNFSSCYLLIVVLLHFSSREATCLQVIVLLSPSFFFSLFLFDIVEIFLFSFLFVKWYCCWSTSRVSIISGSWGKL